MDNTPYVMSNSLTAGIGNWFSTNTYFAGFFKTINNYCRIDNPQSELDAVNVYLLPSNTRTKPSKEIGRVKVVISFNLGEQRASRALQIYQILNAVRMQLITNPQYLQQYLSINYTPGLQMIQSTNDIDFGLIETAILNKAGTTAIPIILDYQISILLNQRALWRMGNDFYSPDTQIYHEIDEIDATIITDPYPN